jgi:hypothetical protein
VLRDFLLKKKKIEEKEEEEEAGEKGLMRSGKRKKSKNWEKAVDEVNRWEREKTIRTSVKMLTSFSN